MTFVVGLLLLWVIVWHRDTGEARLSGLTKTWTLVLAVLCAMTAQAIAIVSMAGAIGLLLVVSMVISMYRVGKKEPAAKQRAPDNRVADEVAWLRRQKRAARKEMPPIPGARRGRPMHREQPTERHRGLLHFAYEDNDGNQSIRRVKNWTFDGLYINGRCLDAQDTRTFRIDRVLDWFEGEELLF